MPSNVYTGTGDSGETSLCDGSRIRKDDLRVEVYGTLDEATSWVGVALASVNDEELRTRLTFLQNRLYNAASNLAFPSQSPFNRPMISSEDVAYLEKSIDKMEEKTGAIKKFILPGGTPAAAHLHLARTVCRRAERLIVTLANTDKVDPVIAKFVNRSSDFLFTAARYDNSINGESDLFWDAEVKIPEI